MEYTPAIVRVCIYLESKKVVAKISVINNSRVETLHTQYERV